jgi:hypothetical protein
VFRLSPLGQTLFTNNAEIKDPALWRNKMTVCDKMAGATGGRADTEPRAQSVGGQTPVCLGAFLWDIADKCVRAIHESPVPENGTWAGRFVNRPYNFVADLGFAAGSFWWDIGNECVGAIHESPVQEKGTWVGRFVNRPYNFVADPGFAAESFWWDIGDK